MNIRYSETIDEFCAPNDIAEMEIVLNKGEGYRSSFNPEISQNSYFHMLYTQDLVVNDYTKATHPIVNSSQREEIIEIVT